MYNINNNNPYGEWTVIPTLNENASPIQVNEYNQMFDKYCTEEVTEKEINEYFERLFSNNNVLNEYQERAWWGVSPFEWTKGLKGFNIFKPLKWLAMPLLGGIVLLLAGLYKLLKEGKKQIAIARVRAWIEKLVVLADSGYKKTRNTKDSLFLIRQRYRRDILQSAVKVATSLGIPVEEKNTKPESVETSLNEAYDPQTDIIIDNIIGPSTENNGNNRGYITFKKGNIVIQYDYLKEDDHLRISKFYVTYDNNEGYTYSLIPGNLSTSETITQDVIDVVKEIDKDIEEFNKNTNNSFDKKILEGKIEDFVPKNEEGLRDFTKAWVLTDNGINDGGTRINKNNDLNSTQDQTQDLGNKDTQSLGREGDTQDLNSNDTQNLNKKSEETQDLSGEETQPLEDDTQGQGGDSHTAVLNVDTMLPDDSRVDWSLMNTIKASQWFGLRHKSTNFWKEAKSVGMILGNENQTKDPVRNCALIISSTSNSLSLVASPGIAQQYASILQKYVQALTNIDIQDTRNSDNYGTNRQDNRFRPINASENIDYDRQKKLYEMFKDDIKIYENASTEDMMVLQRLFNEMPQNTQRQFKQSGLKLEDVDKNTLVMFNMMCQMGQNLKNINYKGEDGKLNIDPDQIDTYLTVALSKALSTTNFNEWQMHRNAYDQMIKFINELTKSVHTIIDSVAKKAESITANGGAADTLISRFLSSKGDPKQNRSLHNLWDNIGVSKLQQRTIVHCEEIMTSPEMQYYLDMFLLTVPAVIKKQLGKGEFIASAEYNQEIQEPNVGENNDEESAAKNIVDNIDPNNEENSGDEQQKEQPREEDKGENKEENSGDEQHQEENKEESFEENNQPEDVKKRANEALAGLESLGWSRKDSQDIILDILKKYPDLESKNIIMAALHWDRNTHDYKK